MTKNSNKYQQRRILLLRKGTNVRRWAIQNGYRPTTVYDALKGDRAGLKSHEILSNFEAFIAS